MKFTLPKALRKGFLRDTSGNIAIIAGLSIIPIVSVAGLAIDFQVVVTKRTTVQQVLDATVIATARERQLGKTESQLRTFANTNFDTLLTANDPGLNCPGLVNLTFTPGNNEIIGAVTCDQPTTISAIFGRDEFIFTVDSSSDFSIGQVDVAFVFDLSGSMQGARLDALKASAKQAVDILLPANAPASQQVRLSFVGYNHSVDAGNYFDAVTRRETNLNLRRSSEGVGRRYVNDRIGRVLISADDDNRRFFDFEPVRCRDDDYEEPGDECNDFADFFGRFFFDSTCVYNRLGDQAFTDARPTRANHIFAAQPFWNFFVGEPDVDRPEIFDAKRLGADQVIDQDGSYVSFGTNRGNVIIDATNDDNNVFNAGAFTTKVTFNGNQNNSGDLTTCSPEGRPLPLTDDRNAIIRGIDDLEAFGGTAGHLGIAWGWYLLSPDWKNVWPRASEPLPYNQVNSAKALIIMTDGEFNTRNSVEVVAPGRVENPDTNQPYTSNEMAAEYCDNLKANTDIAIFTVGFQVPANATTIGNSGQTILQYCASEPQFAFDAANATQLTAAYATIAAEISDLRITN